MSDREHVEGIGGEFFEEAPGTVATGTLSRGRERLERPRRWWRSAKRDERRNLAAAVISTDAGRRGWRVSIPGRRPLATPAVAGGRVFIGGGFGSHEFYSFDAASGKLLWKIRTKDDGPTAATVAGEYVAFNTESCTVYVVRARDGSVVWESWLGDPLMAQTAIVDSTLFVVYPDHARRHQLAAFELHTGTRRWQTELVADAISAPVVAGDSVYVATVDGTVYRIDRETGALAWSAPHRATSAPWIHRGRLFMSLREEEADARGASFTAEGLDTATIAAGRRSSPKAAARRKADYLRFHAETQQAHYGGDDAGVGFASAPSSAKLHLAAGHLGVGHVSSLWAFQGSRPEVFDDGIFSTLDDVIQCLEVSTKTPRWRLRVERGAASDARRALSPPAVTAGRLYTTASSGDLFALERSSGRELWSVHLEVPLASQPAVADGKVFFGTAGGDLYALEADETDAVGWTMWGGAAGHNGPA